MNKFPVAMESDAMLMAISASARPYAGTEVVVHDADTCNAYTPIGHVKMLIWL
jgi:hypothetical protein